MMRRGPAAVGRGSDRYYGEPVPAPTPVDLSPGEWAVLGVVAEAPTHGFAVARLLAPDGPLGQIWSLPRPVVYQAVRKLVQLQLVGPQATERSDRGPQRTILRVTPTGRRQLRRWLGEPVDHVRDVRSLLLIKLALLERAGRDIGPLLRAQRAQLLPRLGGLARVRDGAAGFDRVLAEWRYTSSEATLRFLDAIDRDRPP
jgi:DNA-binding PadR family transcriptional regulator